MLIELTHYLVEMYKILAIETSCDETSVAVVGANKSNFPAMRPLSNSVASQIKLHQKTFGVVPEVAARAHLRKINAVTGEVLRQARCGLNEIDCIAVTAGPGLITSLMVGTEYAKALAFALGKKIIPVNHMLGHLYSALIGNPRIKFPSVNLIVSGGHTYLVLMRGTKNYRVLGQTVDDAAGEAFDKVARLLKLAYPGGPEISKCAAAARKAGDKNSAAKQIYPDYGFPRPMLHEKNFNFSFAGLKTAVLYKIRNERLNLDDPITKSALARSFEDAAVEVLVKKTMRAANQYGAKSITISGGVAANKRLRSEMARAAKKTGARVFVPDFSLCTDNALMIANAAGIMLKNGFKPVRPEKIKADPNWEI